MKSIVIFACLLAASTEAYILSCSFDNLEYLIANEPLYSCFGTLKPDGDTNNINSVVGTHLSGKSNNDIQGFMFSSVSEPTARILINLGKLFPNIKAFFAVGRGITTISTADLQQFLQLLQIELNKNQLLLSARICSSSTRNSLWSASPETRSLTSVQTSWRL